MVWDFAESNPFSQNGGNWMATCIEWVERVISGFLPANGGYASQADAANQQISISKVISTDPPYYDNVPYADLSDFFYVWLRRSLRSVFPDLFATLAVPKAEELVAAPYRQGGREAAERFFLEGMTQAMNRVAEQAHPAFPVTIYYAFKQSETETEAGTTSTGWEAFLDAVIRAGFSIGGTWPMRTEREARSRGIDSNALASSIVLVCRPRPANAPTATRRQFLDELKREMPEALRYLQGLGPRASGPHADGIVPRQHEAAGTAALPGVQGLGPRASGPHEEQEAAGTAALPGVQGLGPRASGPHEEQEAAGTAALPGVVGTAALPGIAPVDLAQAAIGPGMAVYTRYARVIDVEGKALTVRDALALINQTLDEVLAEQEGDFDADTRFAIAWFEQHGFEEGEFGVAETLSKAKNTSVRGLEEAGILVSRRGRVRLLKPGELPADWDPSRDTRLTHWEVVHQLIRVLESGGEVGAAELLKRLGARADVARELAYRLYTICERKKRAQEALSYNALVQSWPEIARLAQKDAAVRPAQETLF
jgi:putative DNA methylase